MKRILLAYDGSESSKTAISKIESFITQNKDIEFCLLSISNITNPYTNAMMQRNIKDKEVKEIQKQHDMKVKKEQVDRIQRQLDEVKKEFEEKGVRVKIEVSMIEGNHNPGENICEYAVSNDVDMIIVGSRGLGNVKKVVLGSVSNYIVNHSNIPVLVVK